MSSVVQEEVLQEQLRKQYIIFQIGTEEYGILIKAVKEIIKPTKITHVPNTKEHILGVINLRGQIVPVVDLRKRIDIKTNKGEEDNTRIITVDVRNTLIGLLVDDVNEVVWLNDDNIGPAPEVAGGIKQEFLDGVGKIEDRLLILINLDKLLFIKDEINK